MWNLKCTIVPVIIRATEIVTRSLKKNLETEPRKHSIDSLQKTAILGTAHIIRKVVQCEDWSVRGGDHRWFKKVPGRKDLWQETSISYNNNNNNNNINNRVKVQYFVDGAPWYFSLKRNNKINYFPLIYFNSKLLHDSKMLAAHHQESQLCVNSNWYSHVLCCLTAEIEIY